MTDLVIIGGGYWGLAIAIEARKAGFNVNLVDDGAPDAGSRAASGIADRVSFKSPIIRKLLPDNWTQDDIDESFAWLCAHGGVERQLTFWNWFEGREPRPGNHVVMLDRLDTLANYVPGRKLATVAERHGKTVILATGHTFTPDRLVIAAGARSETLTGVPVNALFGRALIVEGILKDDSPALPLNLLIAPYRNVHVRPWGRYYRVGDTVEPKPNDDRLKPLYKVVDLCFKPRYNIVRVEQGYRPTTDKFVVEQIEPGVILATGGYRVGLGLAGLVAKKVVEML